MKRIAIIIAPLLAFSAVGYITYRWFVARPYKAEITDTVEKTNGTYKIRVNRHAERGPGFVLGAYYVFQCARTSSDDWRDVMTFRHDDPVKIPENQVRFVNEQIGYVFMGWMYAETTDGGKSWKVWNAEQDLPRWQCCNYRLIEDVELNANGTGRMKLNPIPDRRGDVPELYTQDYGQHWSKAGDDTQ